MKTTNLWLLALLSSILALGYHGAHPAGARRARYRLHSTNEVNQTSYLLAPSWFCKLAFNSDLVPATRWWRIWIAVVAGAGVSGLALSGLLLATLAALAMAGTGVAILLSTQGRRAENLGRDVPDALELVARSCRSGSSIVAAMSELQNHPTCRSGIVFATVAKRVEQGENLANGLDEMLATNPKRPFRLAAAALLVGAETGAAPAKAVEGVAATLRDNAALEREAQALASQARYSAAVLVLAPVGFAVFSTSADSRVANFLFHSRFGLLVLVAGITLDALGAWWMLRLVRAS